MNIIKYILLVPVPWLERQAVQEGQFTERTRRIIRIVLAISIATLLADPILSLIRFGYPGFNHPAYYLSMLSLILALHLVSRPNAETSIADMRSSNNWIVRGTFFVILGGLLVVEQIIGLWPETSDEEHKNHRSTESFDPPIGSDGLALDESTRMAQFMDDMAGPPGW